MIRYTLLAFMIFGSFATFAEDKFESNKISNPILTWESQSNSNIGLDYAILNNVVSGTIEYFQRTSSDLLLDRPLSGTTGF